MPNLMPEHHTLYLILYIAKQACAPCVYLPVCGFIGSREEVVAKVGDLNYHLSWDDVKNNDNVAGHYTWRQLPMENTESVIRDLAKLQLREHFH